MNARRHRWRTFTLRVLIATTTCWCSTFWKPYLIRSQSSLLISKGHRSLCTCPSKAWWANYMTTITNVWYVSTSYGKLSAAEVKTAAKDCFAAFVLINGLWNAKTVLTAEKYFRLGQSRLSRGRSSTRWFFAAKFASVLLPTIKLRRTSSNVTLQNIVSSRLHVAGQVSQLWLNLGSFAWVVPLYAPNLPKMQMHNFYLGKPPVRWKAY